MDIGAGLIGAAAALLLVAYVARPLGRRSADPDAQIEAWVASVRQLDESVAPPEPKAPTETVIVSSQEPEGTSPSFCHRCGRSVKPHHRFCPHCGQDLAET